MYESPTPDQMRRYALNSARRLCKLLQREESEQILSYEAGILVIRLRRVIGQKLLDSQIDLRQKEVDARDSGICDECFSNKVSIEPGQTLCDECAKAFAEMSEL